MRSVRVLAATVAGCALAATCLACAGCVAASGAQGAPSETASLSAGADVRGAQDALSVADEAGVAREDVAAVVDGVVITQREVDDRVLRHRVTAGLASDSSYASYLQGSGLTSRDLRLDAIRELVNEALIEQEAAAQGVEVSADEVDDAIHDLKSRYPSEDAWREALKASGYDEQSYHDAVRVSMLTTRLRDKVAPEKEPTREEVEQYAVAYAPTLAGKRSSMILIAQDDYDLAQSVYQQLLDGADFAEMARAYSIDGSADNGGDMGWNSLTNLSTQCQAALDELDPGELSPIVRTSFGYEIILCTDRYQPSYDVNGAIDLAEIPDAIMSVVVESMRASLAEQAFEGYLAERLSQITFAVFDEGGNQVSREELGMGLAGEDAIDDLGDAVDLAHEDGGLLP